MAQYIDKDALLAEIEKYALKCCDYGKDGISTTIL